MPDELLEPRAASTDQRFYGVAEALVVDNVDPQKLGRVRVIFPWFDPGMESEWCRVSNLYAGNDYGSAFIPEIGDEVLVAFIHGDMRLPIILGGLYNGKDLPPTARDGTKDQKMIRTKGEHEFMLDDTPGKERVRLKTKSGHIVDLSDVDKKITIKSAGDYQMILDDSDQSVTISTAVGQKIVMKEMGNSITIETASGDSIELSITGITLKSTSITLDSRNVSLGVGTQPLLLGNAFLALFNAHVHPTAVGPTGPPTPSILPSAVLSMNTRTS